MGRCLTWFAVKGKPPETVRTQLGLKATGETADFPPPKILGAALLGGWYLVSRSNYELRNDELLKLLSSGCEVISLFVEEHVMVAHLSAWKNGERVWFVSHNSEDGEHHLEAKGDLPPEFAPIRDNIQSRNHEVPFFEIPCRLGAKLTGYRYDAPAKDQITPFEVLISPPWWKKLFGR